MIRDFLKMKVLLITGSNGWLGKATIKNFNSQLINKFQIILINLTTPSLIILKKIAEFALKRILR